MKEELELAYLGEPVLRRKADPIDEVTDEVRDLIDSMVVAMDAKKGIGLAAPQIHKSLRLFIICPYYETEEGESQRGEVTAFINPILSEPSEELVEFEEGCLSIPGVHGMVDRPESIQVEALDREGKAFKKVYSGLEARIIMHENDHINGVLFLDRMDKKERKALEPKLRALKEKLKKDSS